MDESSTAEGARIGVAAKAARPEERHNNQWLFAGWQAQIAKRPTGCGFHELSNTSERWAWLDLACKTAWIETLSGKKTRVCLDKITSEDTIHCS